MSVAAMEQQIRVWGRAVEVQGQRVAAAVNDKMMAETFDDALVETNLFVLALRDLARAAGTVSDLRGDAASAAAVAQFGNAIPDFNEIRIVIEHFDDYVSGQLTNRALRPSVAGAKLGGLEFAATATVSDRVFAGDCTIHLTEEDAAGTVIRRWSLPVGQAVGAAAALVGALTPPVA